MQQVPCSIETAWKFFSDPGNLARITPTAFGFRVISQYHGDTIYPGRLYVRDGKAFCLSISRLATFAKTHPVEFLMGNHIEMSRTKGVDYPVGTIYQPGEHALPLRPDVLQELVKACGKMGDRITYEVHDDFIIVPK